MAKGLCAQPLYPHGGVCFSTVIGLFVNYPGLEDGEQRSWTRQVSALVFEIEQPDPAADLTALVADAEKLRARLVEIVNRVLRAIRNTGLTPHVHETQCMQDAAAQLELWSTEQCRQGEEWTPVVQAPERDLLELLILRSTLSSVPQVPWFKSAFWPAIEEAIEDNLEPGPEEEFVTNALEHLQLGNYRVSFDGTLPDLACRHASSAPLGAAPGPRWPAALAQPIGRRRALAWSGYYQAHPPRSTPPAI